VKAQMREANRQDATHIVFIGEEELASGTCQVKDLSTGEQQSVSFKELFKYLTAV
jgi:histidyl-tRNA synthetase